MTLPATSSGLTHTDKLHLRVMRGEAPPCKRCKRVETRSGVAMVCCVCLDPIENVAPTITGEVVVDGHYIHALGPCPDRRKKT